MINLTINGEQKSFDAPVDMPLLWVLRDILGMTVANYVTARFVAKGSQMTAGDVAALRKQTSD